MAKTIFFSVANVPGTVYKFKQFRKLGYRLVAGDANPDAVGRHFADAFHVLPMQKDPGYMDAVLRVVEQEKVDLFVAGEGESLRALAIRDRFEALGCTLVATDAHTLEIALDKVTLFDFLAEHTDVPLMRYHAVHSLADFEVGLEKMRGCKVCIKPARGSGSRGFVILRDEPMKARELFTKKMSFLEMTIDEMRSILANSTDIPKLVLMEYLEDTNFDSNMVCRNGQILFQSVKTRDEAKIGTITHGHILEHPEINTINQKIIGALGTTGLVAIQYIGNKIIEINPRWSTSLVHGSINEYLMGVQIFTGEPITVDPSDVQDYPGLKMVRFWDIITYKD
ncbi:ATP-grasp domain-containing protein [Levilinea saccharolytica]|uniref:Uncharacterized protein n=1 Tax=Levilinea saccharolytica TaxID=229921 RepID=A0A0M8JSB2_9CHLR|nr:ATP-grasp domain-containing protein [Levilinea saccharolytica]KPL80763.1 hypothetical protein ADN01_11625 [Levilinea saccharolytica]GAP19585.1 hypothetical protein LSAC_03495 [Levilinea saccharolytica]